MGFTENLAELRDDEAEWLKAVDRAYNEIEEALAEAKRKANGKKNL